MSQKMISCKACGKEIAASAKTCPECGAKNKKPIYKKWWAWAIVVVVLIAAVSGGGDTDEPNNSATTSSQTATTEEVAIEYVEYHVNALMAELEQNALKAKNDHDEQYVSLTCRLSNIDSSGDYINIMPTDNEWAIVGVQCYIQSEEQLAAVMEMTIGDTIVVKGKITDVGEVLGYSLKIDSFG